jgi:EPTP domain.
MAKVGTSFGTHISFGLSYTVNNAATSAISTSSVGEYNFVVAYEDGLDSMGKAVCGALTDNDDSEFVEFQAIPTKGAYDWESFTINGEYYIAVANLYDGSSYETTSSIYKWNGNAFSVFQTFSTYGVGLEIFHHE